MTWLDLPADHPFGLSNLPYGVFSTADAAPRVGIRIGDHVLDLAPCAEQAGMESYAVWQETSLNPFLAEGHQAWAAARAWLTEQLTNEAHRDTVEANLALGLPAEARDWAGAAAVLTAVTSIVPGTGHLFSTSTFDLLGTATTIWLLVRAVRNPRLASWLLVGLAAGITAEVKVLVAMVLAACAVGLLVAGPRGALRGPGPWRPSRSRTGSC